MKKRLIYFCYIPNYELSEKGKFIYEFNFKMLKKYINIFDESIFLLSIDDVNNEELIEEGKERIYNLKPRGDIEIHVVKNDQYLRESQCYYDYVITKMEKLDGLTFYGHCKGFTAIDRPLVDFENMLEWVAGSYYFNLEEKYIPDLLWGNIAYGAFKTNTKGQYVYMGSFHWCRYNMLYDYIKKYNKDIPILCSSYLVEEFLGRILDINVMNSYNYSFLYDFNPYNAGAFNGGIKFLYGEEEYKNLNNIINEYR